MKHQSIPLKLVDILADGKFHSGEQLGELLGMSRAAINKYIQVLKSWGLDIYTITGKGYSLSVPLQLLNKQAILSVLKQGNVEVIPVINSTNQYLLERMDNLPLGAACVAEYQQAGRGRRGRQWISPFGTNLYLSMYWRLEQGPEAAIGLSLVIGVVMAETLRKLGAQDVRVKWPNDIYLYDRKLAGILVELIGKTGDVAHIVMGAGINLAMKISEATKINQSWINLQEAGVTVNRNELAAQLINSLRNALLEFEQKGLSPFIQRWITLDNFIHRPVKLLIGKREVYGVARGIDEQGSLLLECKGEVTSWVGGEISLRSV